MQCKLGAFSILRSLFSYGWQWLSQGIFVSFFFCRSLRKNKQMCERLLWRFWTGSLCDARSLRPSRSKQKHQVCSVSAVQYISSSHTQHLFSTSCCTHVRIFILLKQLESLCQWVKECSLLRNNLHWAVPALCVCVCVCWAVPGPQHLQDHLPLCCLRWSQNNVTHREQLRCNDAIFFNFF